MQVKIYKFNYVKVKMFAQPKLIEAKTNGNFWEIFAMYIIDKYHIFLICEELSYKTIRKDQYSTEKWAKAKRESRKK